MQIRVLGPVEIVDSTGEVVAVGRVKPASVFAVLVIHARERVSVDRLVHAVWGESPPATAVKTLQTYVAQLRRLLGERRDVLVTSAAGYRLDVADDAVDARRFERLVRQGHEQLVSDVDAAQRSFADALALWRGVPYADLVSAEFARVEATRLEEVWFTARQGLIETRLRTDGAARVVAEVRELTRRHPLREGLWAQLLRALYASGRQAEALEAYGQVRDLLAGELGVDPGPELRDLEHRILTHTVEVPDAARHAGVGPRAQRQPPHSAPLPSSAASLPVPASSLVGRQTETATVLEQLQRRRIVTLLGPGGVGKTRLALNVGMLSGDVCPDGVWFADLSPIEDPAAVPEIIADTVGVSVAGGGDAMSIIAEFIAKRRGLLIIDNVEHVVGCAPIVSRLVNDASHLRVLATSRERLRLDGEQVYDVEPFDVEVDGDAVRLFLDRARAVRPDLATADDQLAAIAEICARLDGLPLAIELAAARCRHLQPTELAERLRNRSLPLLSRGSRNLHSRQQTIRNTIEWSYQLLTSEEQDVLARLTVFAAPIRMNAIGDVIGSDGNNHDLDDVLGGLVDKSLLQHRVGPEDETRVRMLELVREFAAERLTDLDDVESLRARHAAYYTAWTEHAAAQLLHSEPDRWDRRIEFEFPDVSKAFAWSVTHRPVDAARLFAALGFFLHRTGKMRLARRWMDDVVDIDVPPHVNVRRGITAAWVYFGRRDVTAARREVERALDVAGAIGDPLGEATGMIVAAHTHLGSAQDYHDGLALVRRGTQLAREASALVLAGLGHNNEGDLSRVYGDDDNADVAYGAALALARATGDHLRDAVCHGNRVYIATHRGALDEAVGFARYAVDLHQRYGHRSQLPRVAIALSGALVRQGRVQEAAVLVASAETTADRLGLLEEPGDAPENEHIRTMIAELAGDHLPKWRSRGRAMPLDEALRIALDASGATAEGCDTQTRVP